MINSFAFFSHHGNLLIVENVELIDTKDSISYQYDLINISKRYLQDVKVELIVNDSSLDQKYLLSVSPDFNARFAFTLCRDCIDPETDKVQIEITEIFGKRFDWGGWDNEVVQKQVNTLYSEFYCDAPWRMKKFNATGQLNAIPVHFFLHDADVAGIMDMKIDDIKIQLKNAGDTSFDPVLTYDSVDLTAFQSYFSCGSEYDADLDIKLFDINSFETSNTQTIDFTIDSDIIDDFVGVHEKYWYFTFNIPASSLVGYDEIIDILVTIEYANLTVSDDQIGLRVFRSMDEIPSISGWYRGDTHLHSMYTQNDAEIGLPLCSTKEAAKLLGLDWITTTDHTSDFDNYGAGIQQNWMRIKSEAAALNGEDSSMLYIPGLEVAVNNSNDKLVHMLAYPNDQQPQTMPYLGDGNGDIFPTTATIESVLNAIGTYDGFVYMAHPFATGDELPTIPTNGGIWNLGESTFPINGTVFPVDGGSVICNDPNLGSDLLITNDTIMIKEGIKGGQIWNIRNTLVSTGNELDPWGFLQSGSSFSVLDTSSIDYHFRRFRQGQEVINHVNRIGLQLKNADTTYKNWKLYYSAGTDAHGSFNYSNTDDFAGIGTITNNAVGKLSTVTYCPNGMGQQGENVLRALRNGCTTLSDGPLLAIGLSTNGNDQSNEVIIGEDVVLDIYSPELYYLNIDYSTTYEFGEVTELTIYLGTESGEFAWEPGISQSMGNNMFSYSLADILDSLTGGMSIPTDQYMYLRSELRTERDYTGQESFFHTDRDVFHSISNPLWFRYEEIGLSVEENDLVNTIKVYPNPAEDHLYIKKDIDGVARIALYDQSGRLVNTGSFNSNEYMIDLQELSSGLYYLHVQMQSVTEIFKVIKR